MGLRQVAAYGFEPVRIGSIRILLLLLRPRGLAVLIFLSTDLAEDSFFFAFYMDGHFML